MKENEDFDIGYREMAQDVDRETEALELAEATIGDVCEAASKSLRGRSLLWKGVVPGDE